MVVIEKNIAWKHAVMDRKTKQVKETVKPGVLLAVARAIFDLDEPLQDLCLALLVLSERQLSDVPDAILVRPVNLHAEHFEGYLPPQASLTALLRRLQLENPHVQVSMRQKTGHTRLETPLFEIVSSLELIGANPRINWWVRAGQWSQWGLSHVDRALLCRFALAAVEETDRTYRPLLVLLLVSISIRIERQYFQYRDARIKPLENLEISVERIQKDLIGLEEVLNILPGKIDLNQSLEMHSQLAIEDFIKSNMLQYTDASHEVLRVLPRYCTPVK